MAGACSDKPHCHSLLQPGTHMRDEALVYSGQGGDGAMSVCGSPQEPPHQHCATRALAARLTAQDETHPRGVHGAMVARVALAGPELSAAMCCWCLKAGRAHRSLSSMVLVCGGFATCRLGDAVLHVGGYAGTWCFATCQGTALAHMWFRRGSWSPRAGEAPGCGKLISWG